ncbi:hypothetical protein ACHAWF_014251, partial [Thalassiosira exigua]
GSSKRETLVARGDESAPASLDDGRSIENGGSGSGVGTKGGGRVGGGEKKQPFVVRHLNQPSRQNQPNRNDHCYLKPLSAAKHEKPHSSASSGGPVKRADSQSSRQSLIERKLSSSSVGGAEMGGSSVASGLAGSGLSSARPPTAPSSLGSRPTGGVDLREKACGTLNDGPLRVGQASKSTLATLDGGRSVRNRVNSYGVGAEGAGGAGKKKRPLDTLHPNQMNRQNQLHQKRHRPQKPLLVAMHENSQSSSSPGEPVIIVEHRTRSAGDGYAVHKYIRGEPLGQGASVKVYKATHLDTNKEYAIKTVPKASFARQKQFKAEAEIHRTMKHANICEFKHFFEDKTNCYILLELCHNQSINEMIKRRKSLTEEETRFLMLQIVDAVGFMHDSNVIHRDLKPRNLFLSRSMNVKIGDFGLACRVDSTDKSRNTICGTPNYVAPEVIEGKDEKRAHSFEVDVWSMGVICYAMLVGKPPYESTDVKSTYRRILASEYSFPQGMVGNHARDLIARMLRTDPKMRPSVEEIRSHPFFTMHQIPRSLSSTCTTSTPIWSTDEFGEIYAVEPTRKPAASERKTAAAAASAVSVRRTEGVGILKSSGQGTAGSTKAATAMSSGREDSDAFAIYDDAGGSEPVECKLDSRHNLIVSDEPVEAKPCEPTIVDTAPATEAAKAEQVTDLAGCGFVVNEARDMPSGPSSVDPQLVLSPTAASKARSVVDDDHNAVVDKTVEVKKRKDPVAAVQPPAVHVWKPAGNTAAEGGGIAKISGQGEVEAKQKNPSASNINANKKPSSPPPPAGTPKLGGKTTVPHPSENSYAKVDGRWMPKKKEGEGGSGKCGDLTKSSGDVTKASCNMDNEDVISISSSSSNDSNTSSGVEDVTEMMLAKRREDLREQTNNTEAIAGCDEGALATAGSKRKRIKSVRRTKKPTESPIEVLLDDKDLPNSPGAEAVTETVSGSPGDSGVDDSIKQRIIKLLNMGFHEESNEQEAKNALKLAHRLIERHNLDQALIMQQRGDGSLNDFSTCKNGNAALQGGMVTVRIQDRKRGKPLNQLDRWINNLVTPVVLNFRVKAFVTCRRGNSSKEGRCWVTFYGIKGNAQLAAYAFKVACERIALMKVCYEPPRREGLFGSEQGSKTREARLSYALGVVDGLTKSVKEEMQNEEEERQSNLNRARQASKTGEAYEEDCDGGTGKRGSACFSAGKSDEFEQENTAYLALIDHREKIALDVLKSNNIQLRPGKKRKSISVNHVAYKKGRTDSKEIDLNQQAIKGGARKFGSTTQNC